MPTLINSNSLTFDDILLVPQYSRVTSRQNVDISTHLLPEVRLLIPIVSANMDTVTETAMVEEMIRLGGSGILHRYASHEKVMDWVTHLYRQQKMAIPSIGIKKEDFYRALDYMKCGATAINVDIAHGDSEHMISMVKSLKSSGIKVIAGNVATYQAACRLAEAGADTIKVGIGPGSLCTTRIVTGHGVPQLTAIEECAKVKQIAPHVKVIADGGIKNAGDCVKALAFGADVVMIGSLLAGTNKTPGEPVQLRNAEGLYYWAKEYRGMASKAARDSVTKTNSSYTPEGESTFIKTKGDVENVINQLVGGIRSGCSYSGAYNLNELKQLAQYVIISNSGMAESKPHLLTR